MNAAFTRPKRCCDSSLDESAMPLCALQEYIQVNTITKSLKNKKECVNVMLLKISRGIDLFNQKMGQGIAYTTVLMALITFLVVVLRYGFSLGWIALQESISYFHAAVFLLAAAFTYQQNAHVRVDVFYHRFSAKTQTIVDLIGLIFFMLPISIFITWVCWDYVAESWRLLESSREPGGLPFVYVLKSFLLIFSLSMFLQGISEIIKKTIALRTQGTQPTKPRVEL